MNRLDQQLVGNCLQGNEAAWEEFVRRHSRRIYNLSCRFVRCRAEAEDLTQDVFVRAYQTLKSYRGEAGSLNGWIMRVALNLLIDRYRKTRKEAQLHPIEEEERTLNDPHATNPLQHLARNETKTEVRNALRRLPSNSRIVIELHDLEGLALKEVAAHLHIPEGTVKSRMIRGRRALARIMHNSERRPAEIGHRLDRRWCRYMSFHEAFPAIGISTPVTFGAEGAGE